MAALVFFTSLFLLAALLSVTVLGRLFMGKRGDKAAKGNARGRQATRKPRQKKPPRKAAGASKPSHAENNATRRKSTPPRRFRLPSIPVPPQLVSCLPLGMLFALMVGAGQLALYGMQKSHDGAARDSRLVAFESALDYLGVAALALLVLGLIGAIAAYRRKP